MMTISCMRRHAPLGQRIQIFACRVGSRTESTVQNFLKICSLFRGSRAGRGIMVGYPILACGCCKQRQEKGKEREVKVQKNHKTLYISYLWGKKPWADSHEIWHACLTPRRNQNVPFCYTIFRGFRFTGSQNTVFSLTLLVIVTSVLHYHKACDKDNYVICYARGVVNPHFWGNG